jgi:hypothetical protein
MTLSALGEPCEQSPHSGDPPSALKHPQAPQVPWGWVEFSDVVTAPVNHEQELPKKNGT